MKQMTEPHRARKGDRIAHDLLPGFAMTVEDVGHCTPDGARPVPHQMYKITDPGGNEDWLCAYDVHPEV